MPAGLQGGQLQVFENTNDQERHSYYANDAGPARVEPPSPNTLHTLRGDTYYTFTDHSVDGLVPDAWTEMPSEFRRLSLVLEQRLTPSPSVSLSLVVAFFLVWVLAVCVSLYIYWHKHTEGHTHAHAHAHAHAQTHAHTGV